MTEPDTIVAISTPPGEGGVGLVRLSGANALSIGRAVFHSSPPLGDRIRHVEFGRVLSEDGCEIDTGLAWVFKAPRSYTGEDTVEISCHGSQVVLETLVQAAISFGATAAAPGEFTRRAFCNGRLDLLQAEAVVDLIQSGSQEGLSSAYGHASGRLSGLVRDLKSIIIKALSLVEIGLDFVDEDIDIVERQKLLDPIQQAHDLVQSLLDTFEGSRRRQNGFLIALVGRPNVGKSTLFNALLGEERAIVTPIPGTTRDLVEGSTVWEGATVRLVDTAGIRRADGPVESEGIQRAQKAGRSADLVFAVFDASTQWRGEDCEILELFGNTPCIAVFNKSDLSHKSKLPEIAGFPHILSQVSVSALTGEGLVPLRQKAMGVMPKPSLVEGVSITRQRHQDCLVRVRNHTDAALELFLAGQLDECLVVELREALLALGEMLGEDISEEVLDRIFSDFCIGK